MNTVRLIMDGAAMARMTKGPGGLVWNHLERKAKRVQAAARVQAPVRTGCLRASILPRPVEEVPGGLGIRIVSDTTPCSPSRTSYSLFVHEGTQPHTIVGNPILAFHWANGPNGPGTYFFRSVHHPGTKANRFLTDNLHFAVD